MSMNNVVVIGPRGAGKLTFIQAVRDQENPRRPWRKLLVQSGQHEYFGDLRVDDNLCLFLYGAPPEEEKRHLAEILAEGMIGFICMVDCTRADTFTEAKALIDLFYGYAPVSHVVAANRYDQPNAVSLDDLRRALGIGDTVKLLPCNATDREAGRHVIAELLISILETMEASDAASK